MGDEVSAPFEGRTFRSVSTSGAHLVVGSELRLVFVDGLLVVSGGCNSMRGSYTYEAGLLRVPGPMASTMMACAEELMDQDQWLAGLFERGVQAELVGDRLTLREEGSSIELVESAD